LPLPFGSVTPRAAAAAQILAFVAFALAAFAQEAGASWRRVAPPAAALAGVALLGLVQLAPWPAGLLRLLSPEHSRLFAGAAELTGGDLAPRLTLAPAATLSAVFAWAAALACLLAGAALGRRRGHRRLLLAALVVAGLFQVFFGARGWFDRSRTLWGVELASNPARLRGTFVNPNHLAFYLGILLPLVFAWGVWAVGRARREPQIERRILLVAPPCLAWITLLLGVAFSGSRGGLLATLAAVVLQGVLLPGTSRRRRVFARVAGVAVAAGGLLVVAFVGLREGLGRLTATGTGDVSALARLEEYGAVLALWQRFPLTGSGLGTFRDAFPLVQPAGLEGTYWHPHSDLLEVLATAGAVGAVLVAVGFVALVRRLARGLRLGERSEDRAAALAALGAVTSALIHAGVDFALTMPANAFTLAVIVGAAAAVRLDSASAQADTAGQDQPARHDVQLENVETARHRLREG
jgi:O-antigen ligase